MAQRIVNSLVYAIVAGLSTIVAAGGLPADAVGWCGLLGVVLTSGWGKYTTNQELVWPPSRAVWTEDERRSAAGLPPKRPY